VGARYCAKFISGGQPSKGTKVFQVVLVRPAHAWVIQVGKPFDGGWHGGQVVKLGRRQSTLAPYPGVS
jgi:hypothetical protein